MDKLVSSVFSNPDVVTTAAEKAGDLVEGAVKSALSGKGEKGQTKAGGQAGVKVEGQAGGAGAKVEGQAGGAGAGAKVEGGGGFGLDDALSVVQGDKKDGKDGGVNIKGIMGGFGL
ncbi:PE-PGRS family protein PE_PGRS47 isoform X1 [Oryzias melastigma]|uniref:PE-PGRS family protein PE_PGRS47 isoform X1 n=1 Tax=Oryzias melastigma TaxID=30732 RepID=UPI000CF7EEFB|nr:PE-PGRS family protein PE_PGRS47 isoform X1 [Oryzias melastigma]XP_036071539.1 PE-PGRS family protein PE_PGRS47 isoform X1 [Oryzias melastigma]